MIIVALALSGLRHRTGAFVATFVSATLGAAILMTFAALLDTAAGTTDTVSRDALILMASVAGGWCLLIVVFAVSSTMSLSVRQRSPEMGVLRRAGATPGQLTRMIVGEAVLVALIAAAVAVPIGLALGRVLLDLLADTGQVTASVGYAFGPIALGLGFGVTVLGSVLGALLAARRRPSPARSARGRGRVIAAVVLLAAGVTCGVLTATVMKGQGAAAMQTAGQASIWSAAGLALLAPWLLRLTARAVPRLSASGDLAVINVRQQAATLSGAVMPVIIFVGISTATVAMQAIEDTASAGRVRPGLEKSIQTLNYVVVGMIALFVAIMLVNTVLAVTAGRRGEFARQRLAGATPGQTLTMVAAESALLTVTGVGSGLLASVVTILPYGYARAGDWTPPVPAWPFPLIAAIAVLLTLAATLGATRRAIRGRAITAVA
ncbi:FtsX-like permease family protein [Actinoplanes sp. NPDC051470]|uniref:FtsX-like permease family protein n=1 Tax=Actinoplanes sp. NPDC051470 TaxID=3157224 RepID=UPI003422030A